MAPTSTSATASISEVSACDTKFSATAENTVTTPFSTPPSTPPLTKKTPNSPDENLSKGVGKNVATGEASANRSQMWGKQSKDASKKTSSDKSCADAARPKETQNANPSIASKATEAVKKVSVSAAKDVSSDNSDAAAPAKGTEATDVEGLQADNSGGETNSGASLSTGFLTSKPPTLIRDNIVKGLAPWGQQSCWKVNLNSAGRFCSDKGVEEPPVNGNFRIGFGDSVEITLLGGILKEGVAEQMRVVNSMGEEKMYKGKVYKLDKWLLVWTASMAGPHELQLMTSSGNCLCATNTVIVEPELTINSLPIRSSSLNVQTVVSRCMGPLKRWKHMLKSPANLGYNVIHFTPVQTVGESGSCYSISDQHKVAASFFRDAPATPSVGNTRSTEACEDDGCDLTEEERQEELKKVVDIIEKTYGIMSTTDLVLNHTARDSHWIKKHLECGYNLSNSPHLLGAVELDLAIKSFSDDMVDNVFRKDYEGLCEYIENEDDLRMLMRAFREVCLNKFKIHEWFMIDIEGSVRVFEEPFSGHTQCGDHAAKKMLMDYIEKLIGSVRGPHMLVPPDISQKVCVSKVQFRALLESIQKELYHMGDESEKIIESAMEGNVRHERLVSKKGRVGKELWEGVLPMYFTSIKGEGGEIHYLANNGWVMGWDATKDFAAPGSLVYLRRQLVVWSDCIKLRYGNKPDDNPFLWQWMTKYCENTGRVFRGVRLDNCHSTPLHVAKHMLRACRRVRPSIWVYAELFTGDQLVDGMFERELGLNALIREAMQTHSPQDLGAHAIKYGSSGGPPGRLSEKLSVDSNHKRQLKRTLCSAVFYDCTHDNETPSEKRTAIDALATAAIVCATNCAIGSTRGFDELIPRQVNVVTERRLYQEYLSDEEQYSASPCETPPVGVQPTQQPVVVVWKGDCPVRGKVSVKGDWDCWKKEVDCELHKDGTYKAELKVGEDLRAEQIEYQYKFVVGGQWRFDPDQPCSRDINGNINNIISLNGNTPSGSQAWRPGLRLPGFMEARRILNHLHFNMSELGFSQMSVEMKSDDIQIIKRHSTRTHASVYFIVRSAFSSSHHNDVCEIFVPGKINKTYMAASLTVDASCKSGFKTDPVKINGLASQLHLTENMSAMADVGEFCADMHGTKLKLTSFPPGSVLVFSTHGYGDVKTLISRMSNEKPLEACEGIDLTAASYLLYSCNEEEKDRSRGARGCYDIPCYGPTVYAGLAGVIPILDSIRSNPLSASSHPLCQNISAGNWLIQHLCDRLEGTILADKLKAVHQWLRSMINILSHSTKQSLSPVDDTLDKANAPTAHNNNSSSLSSQAAVISLGNSQTPTASSTPTNSNVTIKLHAGGRYSTDSEQAELVIDESSCGLPLPGWLKPFYVDMVLSRLFYCVMRSVCQQMRLPGWEEGASEGIDPFVRDLAMSSLQFYGYVSSGSSEASQRPSLAAGLPYFSTGMMRNWGRDTFVALKGILLSTCRYEDAKREIMQYAVAMRHGLIPNLLDGGKNPRYNARDATWFFLQAIQDYCSCAPEGVGFLKEAVDLKFPVTEDIPVATIADLIHHVLSSHAKGIRFKEWNAGTALDEHMRYEGFNVEINLDLSTGILYGGNQYNCGTWMDKMGSSQKARNKGDPATPRDGAAVEICGLLRSTLGFVIGLPSDVFPHAEVVCGADKRLSYRDWYDRLGAAFEKVFYVPAEGEEEGYIVDELLVNRRQIYKDVHKATHPWCDYQLRPNVCIAMAVAPDMFNKDRAKKCLEIVRECLWGPDQLGLKTLDSTDWNFRGNYDNADDGEDKHTAHGWNYHQGPEWLWPLGYYLQAKVNFAESASEKLNITRDCLNYVVNHRHHIQTSPWRSLPELTNQNGKECRFGCPAQAWSVGSLLSFLRAL